MKYAGALDGLETKVDIAGFDTAMWTRKRHASAPLKLTYAGGTQKQTEAWQKKLRGKVTELLGGFPKTKAPLNPQTLEVKEFPTYQRQKFVIQTQAGLYLLGYLRLPKKGSAPFPTMICVPGHGRGVTSSDFGTTARRRPC